MERGVCPVLTTAAQPRGGVIRQRQAKQSRGGGRRRPNLPTVCHSRQSQGSSRALPLLSTTPPLPHRRSAPQPPPGSSPRSLQGARCFLGLMRARDSDGVFQSREPELLLLLSERKHFPVRSTQAAALRLARKHLHPVWWLQVTESGCKESRIHAAACPEWLQLSLT